MILRKAVTALRLLSSVCAIMLPLAPRAQLPVIGHLSAAPLPEVAAAFRQGLNETGYFEGRNVVIEELGAQGHDDQLPDLAAELVQRQVVLIFATGDDAPALAAKTATATIPIVFLSAGDPVRVGLVASLSRPGGNVTGVTSAFDVLGAYQLDLLRQLVPKASVIGVLVNPNYAEADARVRELQEAARTMRRQIQVARAGTESEVDAAFATFADQGVHALLVVNDPFFWSHREHIAALAASHAIAAMYCNRDYVAAGGLISYGPSLKYMSRQAGVYAGLILKGAKPSDLPVDRPRKFEVVINAKTAKDLGLAIPQSLLTSANEVIQ